MARKTKAYLKQQAGVAFATAIRDVVLALGGREIEPASEGYQDSARGMDGYTVHAGVFEINTRAGALQVTPYNTFIACRFDEPTRAMAVVPLARMTVNPHSGKWNHHPGPGGALMEYVDSFRAQLGALLEKSA